MTVRSWCSVLALASLLMGLSTASYQAAEPKPSREAPVFGMLRAPSTETVRAQALDWLKSAGKTDQAAFEAVWNQADRPLLDLVADTFALGNLDAKKILDEARDPNGPAPKQVPDLIKDTKLPAFFRANLALAYAQALTSRRVYPEALESLQTVKPEQVVDPAAYFFHRAVAEHGQLQRQEATKSIARLLDDVPESPERYKMVAALMFLDMQSWKDKDLNAIDREMGVIKDRLGIARGGPETQRRQKAVVARLDEIIKKLEQQKKGGG